MKTTYFIAVLVLIGLSTFLHPVMAQPENAIVMIATEASQAPLEAWTAAFADSQDVTVELVFVETSAEVLARVDEADVLVYDEFELYPDEISCGTLSRVYVPLTELGLRIIDRSACDQPGADIATLMALASYVVSPDGQQVAIDLGLLPESVEVTDQAGEVVRIPQPVRRVVSAYGVGTYYVYAVGASDALAAASYLGVRQPATQDAMRRIDPDYDTIANAVSVIGQSETNIEEVAALQPDLILASARTQWLETAAELGIPIVRYEGESLELFKEAMILTGAALGPNAAYRAQLFNNYYDNVIQTIASQTAGVEEAPRAYFSGTEPLRTASGDMYQTFMVEAAGGIAVGEELTGYWNDVNLEQVLVWDPDVIFVPTYGGASVEAFTESDEWAIIPAAAEGRVYQLPYLIGPWDTPGPDSVLGIIWMAETLFPDRVELDCAEQAQYFFGTFYDFALPAEEAQSLCG